MGDSVSLPALIGEARQVRGIACGRVPKPSTWFTEGRGHHTPRCAFSLGFSASVGRRVVVDGECYGLAAVDRVEYGDLGGSGLGVGRHGNRDGVPLRSRLARRRR